MKGSANTMSSGMLMLQLKIWSRIGSKIVFTNGSQDPWRHASKQVSFPNMQSYITSCDNCGHGTDLRGSPQSPLFLEGNSKNCSSPDAVNKD
ncbi:serine carboxypeptidase S28 family protein [Artemisia annua]|uniref:Serine carboxypeptidase S28 family protein n=1 Tax=Artemisia annua TaxID=35608 RepID=A0A2U1LEG7_ARTAN|nr:serine carboxypeptidase S28 family protein [Artemisia annua]